MRQRIEERRRREEEAEGAVATSQVDSTISNHLNQISKIHHVLDALKFLLTLPSYNQETLPGFVPVAQLRAGWAAQENQVNP